MRGIFEIEGLISYTDGALMIEYQPQELFSHGGQVKTVELSLDVLRDVKYRSGISGATITLRPKRLSAFQDIPIASKAQIVLKVKRRDRRDADALVAHIRRSISDVEPTEASSALGPATIPFRGPDSGLRETKGHIFLEDQAFLVLEVEDAIAGEFDTRRQTIKVAPRALQSIRIDERPFRDRIYIRPKGRDLLDAMPGSHKDEIELLIRRKYRDEVEQLIFDLMQLRDRDATSDDEHTE